MKFEYQYDDSSFKLVMELPPDVCLDTVFECFEQFLRGCGYYFDGHIENVPNEEPLDVEEEKSA